MAGGKSEWLQLHPREALLLFSLAAGLVPGITAGWAYGAWDASQAVDAAGQPLPFNYFWVPSWIGLLLGWALGSGICYLGGHMAQGMAAVRNYRVARAKLEAAGLPMPRPVAAAWSKPEVADAATDDLLDKSAFFVLSSRKEKDKFQDALGRYADPTLSTRLKEQTSFVGVGTQKVRCAILFCDIRGFTHMSETLKMDEVVTVLNDYFALGTKVVAEHQGQINKFIGDAILAVFQDPPGYMTGSTACKNAIKAGLALKEAFHRQKIQWQAKIATPFEVGVGVGIHFGDVIMGNFGSAQRMEYTVIGDTVNFASRLCSLAGPGQTKASEETMKNVEGYFTADEMDPVKVKGKSGEYKTFLITGKNPGT